MIRRIFIKFGTGIITGGLLAGCASLDKQKLPLVSPAGNTNQYGEGPEIASLGAHFPTIDPYRLDDSGKDQVSPPEPTGILTLEKALAVALLRSPELTTHYYDVLTDEARLAKARLLPNPEIEFEVEEYDRNGEGFDSAETAILLGQSLELGGKRKWRTRVAKTQSELTGWKFEGKRLDVFTETCQKFIGVLAAQERVALATAAVNLAEKTSNAVDQRVQAGKELPLQFTKSNAALEMARMEAISAQSILNVVRQKLAAMWGAEQAQYEQADGRLDQLYEPLPPLVAFRKRLQANPDLKRFEAKVRLHREALAMAKAARIPDVTVSVGFQQYEEDQSDALAFGMRFPLPLFDRNEDNILAATYELAKAEAQHAAATLSLATQLGGTYAALTAANERVKTLQSKVIPAMEQAFASAHEGYLQGKFGLLDMLDAQRNLFDAKAVLIDALSDYQTALTDIQRVTGLDLKDITAENNN